MSRIALVCSSFAPYRGGVEEHVRHTAAALTDRGHEVVVWTVDRGEHLGVRSVEGITVRYLPTPRPAARAGSLARFARAAPGAWREWRSAARADRPSLLHVHCFGPNGVYAVVLARRLGLPLVVTSHGETTGDDHDVFGRSWLLRRALRAAIRRSAAVTAPARPVLDDLRARFGLRGGDVVPNGVHLDDGVTPRVPSRVAAPVIAAVGRLERTKGFDVLVDALHLVHRSFPQARLRIGGDGSMAIALRTRSAATGVADAVELLGWLDPVDVADLFARADVVVVPSRREAFGIVVLEAWRAGTPVVASRVDGLAELIDDGVTGLLVTPEDAAALAQACVRLLGDPALAGALSTAGSVAVQSFSWGAVADAYARIYSEALR